MERITHAASTEDDGNMYGGREMTDLERRERERKEARHISAMDKITHDASGEGGGNFYEGREMTELELRERKRKESRHVNHHNVVCNECPQKYLLKNSTKSNKVVLKKN